MDARELSRECSKRLITRQRAQGITPLEKVLKRTAAGMPPGLAIYKVAGQTGITTGELSRQYREAERRARSLKAAAKNHAPHWQD